MKTKSKSISEILRQEIIGGKFDAVRKLPSEHQLMRRFSVALGSREMLLMARLVERGSTARDVRIPKTRKGKTK